MLKYSFVGSKETVKQKTAEFLAQTKINEVIAVTNIYDADDRVKSYQLFSEIMNEIICPNCKKAFKVDEAGYADILKQVRDYQFEEELQNRLTSAVKLAEANTRISLQVELSKKDKELLRRLHVKDGSRVIEGAEAFLFVWKKIPETKNKTHL